MGLCQRRHEPSWGTDKALVQEYGKQINNTSSVTATLGYIRSHLIWMRSRNDKVYVSVSLVGTSHTITQSKLADDQLNNYDL